MALVDDLREAKAFVSDRDRFRPGSSVLEALDQVFPNHRNAQSQREFRGALSALRTASGAPLSEMKGRPLVDVIEMFNRAIAQAGEA